MTRNIRGDNQGEQNLIEALEADELDVRRRRALLSELRKVATDRSISILRANLRHADLRSRMGAVFALSQIDTDDAVDGLIECLDMEAGPPFTFAARELGRLRARRAIPALIRTLEERVSNLAEGDKRVIIYALAQMPHRSAVPVLSTALCGRNARTRRVAAMALAQIRAPESRGALEGAAKSLPWPRNLQAKRALRAKPGDASE
jgi:HEAT repeat protein